MFDLREAFLEAAREFPASPYLRHGDVCVTFSEVGPALAQIASKLPALVGQRVVMLLPDGLSAALLHLECFFQGATIIPLFPIFPRGPRSVFFLDRMQADLVFTTPVLQAKFADILRRTAVIVVGSGNPMNLQLRCDTPFHGGGRQRSPVRAVFFTSGTTGKPRVCA